jgi:hypothetical protein
MRPTREERGGILVSGTGGEVANALVCKTSTRGFNSRPVLQNTEPITRPKNRRAAFPLQEAALLFVAHLGKRADRLLYLDICLIYRRNVTAR